MWVVGAWGDAVGQCVVDWIAVTKYVGVEPGHGGWGGEEELIWQ